jgi:hypothetical protein
MVLKGGAYGGDWDQVRPSGWSPIVECWWLYQKRERPEGRRRHELRVSPRDLCQQKPSPDVVLDLGPPEP